MYILPFSEQIPRQPVESERQHKELTTKKKRQTQRKRVRERETLAIKAKRQSHSTDSNDAHSYDYLMVTFIFPFFFLSFIFRSSLVHLKIDCCCCFSCFLFCFFCSPFRFGSFWFICLYVLLFLFRLNAIIQINDRVCQRCQMTGNGHNYLMCVLGLFTFV